MPDYSLTVETTSNATAGAVLQFMMPASRNCRLLGVLIKPQQLTNTQQSGGWQVDRISAVDGAHGASLVPLKLDPTATASVITDTAHSISTTLAIGGTVADAAIVQLADGWNWFLDPSMPILSGLNQGFQIKRSTAPTGAQVVDVTAIWREL